MRVLIISNMLPPRQRGGYELACYNLAKGLIARGHDVRILTSDTEKRPTEDQSFVDRALDLRRFQEVPIDDAVVRAFVDHEGMISHRHNTVALLSQLREFRPDHVLAFNLLGIGGLAMIDLLNSVGAPWTFNLGDRVPWHLIAGFDDDILDVFGARGGALFSAGQIAAVSQGLVDEIRAGGIPLGDRVEVISRGVIPHGRVRTRAYRDGGITRFVAAGTVGPHKGMDIVLRASRLLLLEGRRDFTVDIYGDGIVDQYRELARELGVEGVVTFHGPIPQLDLIDVHSRSDAFLFPTWEREPLGGAPIEAASVGCVPIITASCGAAERLADGIHCIKIRRDDDHLAAAMRAVCDGEVDLEKLGEAGQRLALGDLSFDRSVELLEALLASGNRPGWQDASLDSAAIGEDLIEKDSASVALLYARIAEATAPAAKRRSRPRSPRQKALAS